MRFPFSYQLGARDCGPACLKMVADYYGQRYALDFLREKCSISKVGVSLLGISEAAEAIGFRSTGVKANTEQLKDIVQDVPVILHWKERHFVVLYKAPRPNRQGNFYVADPDRGIVSYKEKEFTDCWTGRPSHENRRIELTGQKNENPPDGYALILEPTPAFYDEPRTEGLRDKLNLPRLWNYFTPHKNTFLKLVLIMIMGSVITLVAPYLTQALVDRGINLKDYNMVVLILAGQLAFFAGNILMDILRSHFLLHMGTKINIAMVSDFLSKLLRLPLSFFETHITGDLMQRMQDHRRVESLLTITTLGTIFSLLSFIVLSIVLAVYSSWIFALFITGSLMGFAWTLLFLWKRRKIDFQFFELYSRENNKVIEIMTGMPDIKLSNGMRQKRWEWENIQARLYKLKIRSLKIGQLQSTGSSVFRQGTSILISFLAAREVIGGHISLGTLFAITMIVGQLNSPLEQLRGLVTAWQDARLGMERIADVMNQQDEDPEDAISIRNIPEQETIRMKELSFGYGSDQLEPVLKNLSLEIPAGKVTAIVGPSGSGKTTLMKLLLRFYEPKKGSLFLGGINFKGLHHGAWREKCGVVIQDGQLFSGTIADNIALGHEKDFKSIAKAARIACLDEFIESLPLGYMTEVGAEGIALSAGQTQRILLARAIYKNPAYLFLDEATSALDANNEKKVIENLQLYFKGRTVVIIAHRLSTVKNADQVIVLEKGEVVESGSHLQLTNRRGMYYTLIKNQLELEN